MKKRFSSSRGVVIILRLSGIISVVVIILILVYAVTNVTPGINTGRGSRFGLLDFDKGVPVAVSLNGYISDRSFYGKSDDGSWAAYSDDAFKRFSIPRNTLHIDTISTEYEVMHGETTSKNEKNGPAYITQLKFLSGVMNVESDSLGRRLLLVLPRILYFAFMAIGAWQLANLLDDILADKSFSGGSYRYVRRIAWGIIAYQLTLMVFYLELSRWSIFVFFHSTIPNYNSPLQLTVQPVDDFSIAWLLGGFMLLTLSYAFRKGIQLQREQDLTI